MDRPVVYGSGLASSFSVASLPDGSEAISEAEEINEVKSLKEKGDKAVRINDCSLALQLYGEALEIDERSVETLVSRASTYIKTQNYDAAHRDAELLTNISPNNAQAHYLNGVALKYLKQSKEAMGELLMALDLDPDHADQLTNHIAAVAASFCDITQEVMTSLKDMDAYKKMSEVGVCLFNGKKYSLCIKILEAAQKFKTNQKGITMRVLLTLANGHSALKHVDHAIGLYQDCLTTAVSAHDHVYQTKALVNIATLYLEKRDTHQAIVHYEKLLDLQAELLEEAGDMKDLPDFWTTDLQCGLYLNLSIAYKTIGNVEDAVRYAVKYATVLEELKLTGKTRAESYHNVGTLNEIMGKYPEALSSYQKYYEECRRKGNKKGVGQAYGCLGSIYTAMHNWKLALTYLEQYVAIATKAADEKMLSMAYEMTGDMYMAKVDHSDAVTAYEAMVKCCGRTNYRVQAMGYCKMGTAYKAMKKYQYSLYFYERAHSLAKDLNLRNVEIICEFNMAQILQYSTQVTDIEQAQKYFERLLPFFESKIQQHRVEATRCVDEYHIQLQHCYDGIQTVLTRLGVKETSLQYSESFRRRYLTQIPNFVSMAKQAAYRQSTLEASSVDKLVRVVSQQNSLVLYYSVLPRYLLLWVLEPSGGLIRVYSSKTSDDRDITDQIHEMLEELLRGRDQKRMVSECENRSLPLRSSPMERLQAINEKKSIKVAAVTQLQGGPTSNTKSDPTSDKRSDPTSGNQSDPTSDTESDPTLKMKSHPTVEFQFVVPEKPIQQKLYDLLLAPVDDLLSTLPCGSNVIIVPDKNLACCPFGALQDWSGRCVYEKLSITYVPSLLCLEKALTNELDYLKAQDDLEFERAQSRHGSVNKYLNQYVIGNGSSTNCTPVDHSESPMEDINPRQVSNPRLLKSGCRPSGDDPGSLSREHTFYSTTRGGSPSSPVEAPFKITSSVSVIPELVKSVTLRNVKPLGSPTSPERLLNQRSVSTLTSRTWTGTDITASTLKVTEFQQISNKECCFVFGNPSLPHKLKLFDSDWHPGDELTSAKQEVKFVSSYLGVNPVTGDDASKERFLEDICTATVAHIATFGCWKECVLVTAPNDLHTIEDGPPREEMYLVTASDIVNLKLRAQLVVLSCGWNAYRKDVYDPGFTLASAFVAAGAQCVLLTLWAVPDNALEKFFYHFYQALQSGSLLTKAVSMATTALAQDDRFADPFYWSGFALVGKDVLVDIRGIRRSMLDQTLDRTEAEVQDTLDKELLNPRDITPKIQSKEARLYQLQMFLGQLLKRNHKHPQVIPTLMDMLDESLKRLHTLENNSQTRCLPREVSAVPGAVKMLKLLGFHFQAKGALLDEPYVIYPHWNNEELLVPIYDGLRALTELVESASCVQSLYELIPASQDVISHLIDVLCITKHAQEIQLKVSDLSVRPLWQKTKVKAVMKALGFHQIAMLLAFSNMPENRRMMTAMLQLLLSISCHKSQVLLYRLDVSLLGKPSPLKTSTGLEFGKLPSLTPLVLPRNQLRVSTPWMSTVERPDEMREKMKLAESKQGLDKDYVEHVIRARSWHQATVVAQGNEALENVGRPKTSPAKVKVISGSSASGQRVPVVREPEMDISQTEERRDYAHYVLGQRVKDIEVHHRSGVRALYLPYVHST